MVILTKPTMPRRTGVGRGAYKLEHVQYARRPGASPLVYGYRDTHSTYLNILAETGFVGLFLFLGVIGAVLAQARRAVRRGAGIFPQRAAQLRVLTRGLVAYMLGCAVFGSVVFLVFVQVQIALIAAMSLILAREARIARAQRRAWSDEHTVDPIATARLSARHRLSSAAS